MEPRAPRNSLHESRGALAMRRDMRASARTRRATRAIAYMRTGSLAHSLRRACLPAAGTPHLARASPSRGAALFEGSHGLRVDAGARHAPSDPAIVRGAGSGRVAAAERARGVGRSGSTFSVAASSWGQTVSARASVCIIRVFARARRWHPRTCVHAIWLQSVWHSLVCVFACDSVCV